MTCKTLKQELIGPGSYFDLASHTLNNVDDSFTISLISQIQYGRKRRGGKKQRQYNFWGGDGCAYGLKEKNVILYLTDVANNPWIDKLKKYAQQLRHSPYVFIEPEKVESLEAKANDPDNNGVISFDLSELCRKDMLWYTDLSDQFCMIKAQPELMSKGKGAFRQKYGDEITAMFDWFHGKEAYGRNGYGALLHAAKVDAARIYLFTIRDVRNALDEKDKGTMIANVPFIGSVGQEFHVDLTANPHDKKAYIHFAEREEN